MGSGTRYFLPLLHILQSSLSEDERQIVLDHLDQRTTDYIAEHVVRPVLSAQISLSPELNDRVKDSIRTYTPSFEMLLSTASFKKRRRALAQIGGETLSLFLEARIPPLASQLKKKPLEE